MEDGDHVLSIGPISLLYFSKVYLSSSMFIPHLFADPAGSRLGRNEVQGSGSELMLDWREQVSPSRLMDGRPQSKAKHLNAGV